MRDAARELMGKPFGGIGKMRDAAGELMESLLAELEK